jgi:hypothetical protein
MGKISGLGACTILFLIGSIFAAFATTAQAAPMANSPKALDCQMSLDGRSAPLTIDPMDSADFQCSKGMPGSYSNPKNYQAVLGSTTFALQFGEFSLNGQFCSGDGGIADFHLIEQGTAATLTATGLEVVLLFSGGDQATIEQGVGVSYPCKIISRY